MLGIHKTFSTIFVMLLLLLFCLCMLHICIAVYLFELLLLNANIRWIFIQKYMCVARYLLSLYAVQFCYFPLLWPKTKQIPITLRFLFFFFFSFHFNPVILSFSISFALASTSFRFCHSHIFRDEYSALMEERLFEYSRMQFFCF